ncbi:hypothetical protein HK101_011205 [Irineochytrium annulatum]|nr:hypothetical protein HK101_011205 [Irineochytrium annulatum]
MTAVSLATAPAPGGPGLPIKRLPSRARRHAPVTSPTPSHSSSIQATPPPAPASTHRVASAPSASASTSPSRMLSNTSMGSSSSAQGRSTPPALAANGLAMVGSPASLSTSSSAYSLTSPPLRRVSGNESVKETGTLVRDYDPATGNKMINRYMIVKELGRGVHGKVKLCVDVETGDQWAIKIVEKHARRKFQNRLALSQRIAMAEKANGDGSGEDEVVNPQLEKIKREIAILKKLDHPHVVKLREVIDDPHAEKIYLVLEYLPGRDIKWNDRGEPPKPIMTLDECRRVLRDVVCGLEYRKFSSHTKAQT